MNLPALKDFFRKLFNIRRGEEVRSSLMLAYIFLVISSLMIVKPVCTSLFLHKLGPSQLPTAFILVALSATLVSYIYSNILKTLNLKQLIIGTLRSAIVSIAVFWGFFFFGYLEGWILYVFYIWVAIFAVISVSQFWILATTIFNPREAKRLFGFIGSGAIAGGVFGGYLTKVAAPIIGSEHMLPVSIAFLAACIPIMNALWGNHVTDTVSTTAEKRKRIDDRPENPFTLIAQSKLLQYITGIMAVSVVTAKLVEYQFSAIASSMITDEDQLTAFFGFWLSNLNVVSLIIQLVVTRKVVGVFGVGTALFFLPAGITIGVLGIVIQPALWSAIVLKISDGSLKNSINKAGIELLILPVPTEVKKQVKSFIDIFVDSIATGVGGILLLILTVALGLSVRQLSFVMFILLGFWIFLIVRVRYEYIQSFRQKIEHQKKKTPKPVLDPRNESIFGGLIKVLNGTDEHQILEVLRMIKDIKNDRLIPCFRKLIKHPSSAIRVEVLRNIYYYRSPDFTAEVTPLINDDDLEVKTEAIHYLFQHTAYNRIGMLQEHLRHKDFFIKHAALLCAALESKNNEVYREAFGVETAVNGLLGSLDGIDDEKMRTFTKVQCAKIIGVARIPELYRYLYELVEDAVPAVARESIISMGLIKSEEFIPLLIKKWGETGFQDDVYHALLNFGPGIINAMVDVLEKTGEGKSVLLGIPKLIASFDVQPAVDALVRHLEHPEPDIRREIVKALNGLRTDNPSLKFDEKRIVKRILEEARTYTHTLAALYMESNIDESTGEKSDVDGNRAAVRQFRQDLIKALEEKLDSKLEIIFLLLGLKYPPDDINNIYIGILSHKPEMRTNAIEFLDNILSTDLKKWIIPIIETTLVDALIEKTLERFGLRLLSEYESLELILSGDDISLKECTIVLIGALKDERYIPMLRDLVERGELPIKEVARNVLDSLQS